LQYVKILSGPFLLASLIVTLKSHLTSLRQAISIVRKDVDENGHLPGFSLAKKGMNCVVPIFKECILSGSPDMKEQAAICLQEQFQNNLRFFNVVIWTGYFLFTKIVLRKMPQLII
jgi:hypothetical protein